MSYNAVAEKAPDFTLKTQAGETISLSDYKGKPLILHFWATWCPYCKKLQPGLNRLYTKYKKQGLEMLAISLWEDEGATPQAVLNSRGYKLTTVINGDKLSKKYKVAGTPTTFFISKTGQIVFSTSNSNPDAPELEQAIKMILK
ncbi:peroxiredoxin family protein [Pseudoalteromonas denitrificans]|nr:TlpA disulfide reductase family protein [Pseudoalteromonas denitrificans]